MSKKMYFDAEPEAKRSKPAENEKPLRQMAAIKGTIEAVIQKDHPKHRFGEVPDGFSSLAMSPSNRYGAEIQVFCQNHRSLVVDKFLMGDNAMIRMVDFATLQYSYYWFEKWMFRSPSHIVSSVYWLDDKNLVAVIAENVRGLHYSTAGSKIEYIKFKIDHKHKKMEEVWKRHCELDGIEISYYIPGVFTNKDNKYFVLTIYHDLWFFSITDQEFQPVKMIFDDEGYPKSTDWLIKDGFLYFVDKYQGVNHLVRINLTGIEFTDEDWLQNKYDNNQLERLFVSNDEDIGLSSYNKDRIFLKGKVEPGYTFKSAADEFSFHLVDVHKFTCKELDIVGKPGDFEICYNEYLVVFNHFTDGEYPLKDTPLKYRAYQIIGSSAPSLQSLAGAATILTGCDLPVRHLCMMLGFHTEK